MTTSKERVWAAVRLEKPDRAPVAVLGTAAPMSRLNHSTVPEFFTGENGLKFILNVFEQTGGWDMDLGSVWADGIRAGRLGMNLTLGTKLQFPGIELPGDYQVQVLEQEYIKPEDYDKIIEMGWNRFVLDDYIFRLIPDLTKAELKKNLASSLPAFLKAKKTWEAKGMEAMYPTNSFCLHPFFRLSIGRSMLRFIDDLYHQPEKAEKAIQVMTDEWIKTTLNGAATFKSKIAFTAEERASATFIPPRLFEKYWWPYTEKFVNALWEKGIVTWFHLDTCWDMNMKYFKKLPRGSAIIALDGTSDIFHAKKVLNDHLCIAGDVQAGKLSVASPKEVEAYCHKLIREVGGNGGFILNSGCEVPDAVKMENLKAMVQAPRTFKG